MIEERARVVAANQGFVWVETQRHSTCEACAVNTGCGTSVISKVVGQRRNRVRALNRVGARTGDEVVIAVSEHAFLIGSVAIYLVPLALMLVFAFLGHHLSGTLALNDDAAAVILGMAGLCLGFLWLAWFARSVKDDGRYQPVVLRFVSQGDGHN